MSNREKQLEIELDKVKISEFLKELDLTENQFYGVDEINDNLFLGGLTEIPKGFNPKINGYLEMPDVEYLHENFQPIVTRHLDLGSLKEIPKGFNPTVGTILFLDEIEELGPDFKCTIHSGRIKTKNFLGKLMEITK